MTTLWTGFLKRCIFDILTICELLKNTQNKFFEEIFCLEETKHLISLKTHVWKIVNMANMINCEIKEKC